MNNTKTTQTNNYTDEEKALAEKYEVEPKTCRLISEIVGEHTEGINQLVRLMQGKKEPQLTDVEKILLEGAEEIRQEAKSKGPGATVEDMVEDWLRKQDYSTKLAICIFSDYMCGDHGANNITHRIENEYRAEIINRAKNPNDSLSNEEILMTGICCELAVWSKNL